MKIDYSPLHQMRPSLIKSEKTDMPKLNNIAGSLFLTVLAVAGSGIIGVRPKTALLLSPIIFLLLWKFINKSGHAAIRLSNFAVKNGFTYQWGIKGDRPIKVSLSGVIGRDNKEIAACNIISGTYNDMPFQMFNPYSKSVYSIMKVKLQNKYPHIVLDGQANDSFRGNINHFFSEEARISLEGDFDTYFKVYAKAPAIDTLRILSPDMMSIMVDSGHKYDIEIVEDNLHIISSYRFAREQEIKYLFELADLLLDKLDRRAATKQAKFDHTSSVT